MVRPNDSKAGNTGDYFADVSKSDMMRVILALATEVYSMRDRQDVLERILSDCQIDLSPLDEEVEAAAYDPKRLAERDAFVARVFAAMARPVRIDKKW